MAKFKLCSVQKKNSSTQSIFGAAAKKPSGPTLLYHMKDIQSQYGSWKLVGLLPISRTLTQWGEFYWLRSADPTNNPSPTAAANIEMEERGCGQKYRQPSPPEGGRAAKRTRNEGPAAAEGIDNSVGTVPSRFQDSIQFVGDLSREKIVIYSTCFISLLSLPISERSSSADLRHRPYVACRWRNEGSGGEWRCADGSQYREGPFQRRLRTSLCLCSISSLLY